MGWWPLSFAYFSEARITHEAPSLSFEAFAAVMVPVLRKAGLSLANLSGRNFWHSSSLLILTSPLGVVLMMSAISQSKVPFEELSQALS